MGKYEVNIPAELVEIEIVGGYIVPGVRWSMGIQDHPGGGEMHVSQGAAVLMEQARVVANAADMSVPAMMDAAAQVAPPIHAWLLEVQTDPRSSGFGAPPLDLIRDAMKRWGLYTCP